jgi:hypothetical integral membrane protein (TIGR02206 family)
MSNLMSELATISITVALMSITIALHLKMVLFTLCVVVLLSLWGFRQRKMGVLQSRSTVLGVAMLALWLCYNAYYFFPGNFRWDVSLPLHVCDILGPVSAIALMVSNRKSRALLYFCGLTLAGQAIATPTGNQDPEALRFWLYWLLHVGVIAFSVFDLTVRGYRPNFSDLCWVVLFDVAYVALVTPLNVAFGWNYGYLGDSRPDAATAVDMLGPWPERVFIMLAVVVVLQVTMLCPWLVYRSLINKKYGESS